MKVFVISTALVLGCSTSSKNVEDLDPVEIKNEDPISDSKSEDPGKATDWKKFFTYNSEKSPNSFSAITMANKVDLSNVDVLFTKASVLVQEEKYKEAESILSQILRYFPNHLRANLALVSVLLNSEKTSEANMLLNSIADRAQEKSIDSPFVFLQFRFLRALALYQSGNLQESRASFAELINQFHDFAPAYVSLAQTYLDHNAPQSALFVIKKGYQQAEQDVHLNNMLGVVLEKLGKQEEALHYFRKASELNQTYLPALVNQARIYLTKRSLNASEVLVKDILEIDSDNELAHTLMAILLAEKGELELATDRLKLLHKKHPENAFIRFNLALLYGKNQDTQYLAQTLLDEVITLSGAKSPLGKEASYQKSLNFSKFAF